MATIQPLKLRFSRRARLQLVSIDDYLHQRSPQAARAVGTSIREAAELLRFFPLAGRSGRVAATREWVVRRVPYILVYEVHPEGTQVTILGVFHAAQRRD